MISLAEAILRLLPKWVHRIALRIARCVLKLWYRVHYRPSDVCAVIVQNEEGQVLLVRHSYLAPETWMLPAGKMNRREHPLAAAEREIEEEVRCKLSAVRLLEFEDTEFWGRRHTTFIVAGTCGVTPDPDLREIDEAAFFHLSDLPASMCDPTRSRLERWRERCSIPFEVPAFVRLEYVQNQIERQIP